MSHQAERRSLQIFDQYLEDALQGKKQAVEQYLRQCPESEVEGLQEVLAGADFLLAYYYCPRVKQSTVDQLLQELQEMARRKQAFRWARERAASAVPILDIGSGDPAAYLLDLLDLPASLLQTAPAPASSGRGAFAIMHRGAAPPAAQQRRLIDDMQLQALERLVAPKAEKAVQEAGIAHPPVDVYRVAEEMGLFVQETRLSGKLDGCIVTDGTIGGILINTAIEDKRRRRFTGGHETGHFVLHRHDIRVLRESIDDVSSFYHDRIEQEANTFASYLLMPPFLMPADLGKRPPSLAEADELGERFDVSLAAVLRRLVRASHWRCAFVVTQDGVVQWTVRSPQFDGYIPTGQKPHRDSMAALLLRTSGDHEDTTRLPAEAWIEGPLTEEKVEVREESRRLRNGYVYTLLTVIESD